MIKFTIKKGGSKLFEGYKITASIGDLYAISVEHLNSMMSTIHHPWEGSKLLNYNYSNKDQGKKRGDISKHMVKHKVKQD